MSEEEKTDTKVSNKVIQMPPSLERKKKKLKEDAKKPPLNSVRMPSPYTPEEIKARGYSDLVITIRIQEGRPIDMGRDVSILYDGSPLTGIGEIMVSGMPPHFRMGVTNPISLQESINKAGFFYNQGFFIYQVLLGANYPAVLCGECQKGFLRINHGMRCDNGECKNASNLAKSEYLKAEYLKKQSELRDVEADKGIIGNTEDNKDSSPEPIVA